MNVLRISGQSPVSILTAKIRSRVFGLKRVEGASADADDGASSAYAKNLAKLIPGEALSLYAAGSNVQVPAKVQDWHIWPVYCLVAAIIFRWLATRKKGSWIPQVWAIAISVISFVLWLYTQGDWILRYQMSADFVYLVKYTMLFWVFVIPALVSGDEPADQVEY